MIFLKTTLFILLLLPQLLLGQAGFERVYLFDDTLSRFTNVYVTDSCYYLFGQKGNNTNRAKQHFAKLDLNGNVLESHEFQYPNAIHFSGYPYQSKSTLNFRGNFVFGYTIKEAGIQRPFLCELSPNGTVIFDSLYSNVWNQDSLNVSLSNFEVLSDSTYLISYNYGDYSSATGGGPTYNRVGVIVFKIRYTGEILWEKRFVFPELGIDQRALRNCFLEINTDLSFTLGTREVKFNASSVLDVGDIAKVHFIYCDANGNEINRHSFQDTPFSWGSSGFELLSDGTSLFSYLDADVYNEPPLMNLFKIQPCIARLNLSKQVLWKTRIAIDGGIDPVESFNINDLVTKGENVYCSVSLYDRITDISVLYDLSFNSLSVETGQFNWQRKYNLFPEDSLEDASFTVYDIDTTFDGGFILAGNCFRWSQNQGDKPRQNGYILKTNCLGFLGSPQAAVTILSSSLDSVVFVNSSIQAGSYFWDFGDGNTLQTGENSDTISHVYAQAGTYTIKLIAEGCNGDNDTLTFSHTIASPPQSYGDGTLLSVFPNPTISGQDATIYIGNISGTHELVVTDFNGKKVTSYSIEQGETTYFVPTTKFAKGMYQFSLLQNGEVREVEKLIIE